MKESPLKIQSILFISHSAIAAIAVVVMVLAKTLGTTAAAGLAIGGLLGGAFFASFLLAKWIARGLQQIETAVADHETAATASIGIDEFDRTSRKVGSNATRWDDIAANHRDQARDIQSIMLLLDRRGGDQATTIQLRKMLAGIGGTLQTHLKQIETGTADIERYTNEIAEDAEAQGNAVTKTTTYVEQMSSNIDLVTGNAEAVKKAIAVTSESAAAALDLIQRLSEGMDRIGEHCRASENRLRGLADPSQQVSAIVSTISDIAARTDMLALNASIESIRAGEHGRGFAIVADEVRKLAEQASQATSEIGQLLDSMRVATQESIASIAVQRSEVAAETKMAEEARKTLTHITASRMEHQSRAKEIATAAHQQLQLAQDVVLAVEQIAKLAKANRGSAENACWAMRSLTKTTPQFDAVIERLCGCADTSSPTVAGEAHVTSRSDTPANSFGVASSATTTPVAHLAESC